MYGESGCLLRSAICVVEVNSGALRGISRAHILIVTTVLCVPETSQHIYHTYSRADLEIEGSMHAERESADVIDQLVDDMYMMAAFVESWSSSGDGTMTARSGRGPIDNGHGRC